MLIAFSIGYSQVTNEGSPKSWDLHNIDGVAPIVMPAFDLVSLQRQDAVNDLKKDRPYRFGHQFLVDNNLENSGKWDVLENGDRIWRIRYYSEGAKTMNFVFSDFYLPRGATLYLYSNDRKELLGAYDEQQNNEKRVLGTWLVKGQDIWLEYYEPKAVRNQGKLEVFKVVHGYRTAEEVYLAPRNTNDLNDSQGCEYDVNCTMGTIDNLKDVNKKAVAMMIVGGSGFCTGTLINNTSNDRKPYFLTADHCYTTPEEPGELDPSTWSFRFNWISPNPVCAEFGNSTNDPGVYTTSFAQTRARRPQTDFILVELNNDIPESWDVVWAGWSRSTTPPPYTFGIHHPAGDIMKVSIDENPPSATNVDGMDVWRINAWNKGVTEGGSSGSALFDNNGRIIGQLFGGTSFCNGSIPDSGWDAYGRFNVSWGAGLTAASRLKEWLDPTNTNAMTLDPFNGDLGVEDVAVNKEISIYPNPSSNGIFTVNTDTTLKYEVYNVLGQSVKTGELTSVNNTVNLSSSQKGIYILKLVDVAANKTTTRKIVKE